VLSNLNFSYIIFLKLLQAVEYKPLEEKDLYGLKISKRALKHLTPSEIRDLHEVFSTFDRDEQG
jgi:Ca2+-binding EF-hand superfamily protein